MPSADEEAMTLTFHTTRPRQVLDITTEINERVKKAKAGDGLCHLFLTHTTAAITTADLDPGTDLDMLEVFEKMVPRIKFRHAHDPAHTPSHILSSLIGTSLIIPVKDGELVLGTWQRVVLIEFDGPKERTIIVSFIGLSL